MGWPTSGIFTQQPAKLIEQCMPRWEQDGMRVLEFRWTESVLQILFSCLPHVAPGFVTQRAKGRLDHALREAGIAIEFSRKLALRAIGDNTRRDVEVYIGAQIGNRQYADPRYVAQLSELTMANPLVDLSIPTESARGRYWCNLHLVLVVDGHSPIHSLTTLRQLHEAFIRIANKKGHAVSRLSVMPDYLHASLRWPPNESPLEVVYSYQNNLAYLTRAGRIWSSSYYVGTFGEYTMQAVRNRADDG